MPKIIEQPIKIRVADQESDGKVEITFFSLRERLQRALKWLGLFWFVAVATLFVPILHFFLVPLFFLTGLIVAVVVYQWESLITGGMATCPKCHQNLPIASSTDRWPLNDLCTACRTSVTIVKLS